MKGVRVRRAPVEQTHRQAEIVLHHQIAVSRGGVGDRAHVDDGIELAAVEPTHQLSRRHKVRDPVLGEVAPLGVVLAEHVVDDDVARARLVEARDHVRPDEARPARDQKHYFSSRGQPLPQSGHGCKWDRRMRGKSLRKR